MDAHEPAAREAARRKLEAPAIGIVVVAGLDAALCAFGLMVNLFGMGVSPFVDARGDERAFLFLSSVWGAAWCSACLALSVFLIWAALKMRRLGSYPLALTACTIAIVPCLSPCCILGFPFGIWGLIVMHDHAVRPHFPG